jgi:hypothetical protein
MYNNYLSSDAERVVADIEDDGDRRGCSLRRQRAFEPIAVITANLPRTTSAASAGNYSSRRDEPAITT